MLCMLLSQRFSSNFRSCNSIHLWRCLSYQDYNFNTPSNYLSKAKVPYETEKVRVERKNIFFQPKIQVRTIVPIVRKVALREANDYEQDLNYWLSKTPVERLSAVTFLARQSISKGQRMDKTKIRS